MFLRFVDKTQEVRAHFKVDFCGWVRVYRANVCVEVCAYPIEIHPYCVPYFVQQMRKTRNLRKIPPPMMMKNTSSDDDDMSSMYTQFKGYIIVIIVPECS